MFTSKTCEGTVTLSLLGLSANSPCKKDDRPSNMTWLFCKFIWIVMYIIVLNIVSNHGIIHENAYLQDLCIYLCTISGAILYWYPLKKTRASVVCVNMGSQNKLVCSNMLLLTFVLDNIHCCRVKSSLFLEHAIL